MISICQEIRYYLRSICLDLRRPGARSLVTADILDKTAGCREGSDVVYGWRSGKVPMKAI